MLLYIRMHATNFNFFTFLEINVFEENSRKEGVDQVDQVGEAEIECVIGVSKQVIIILFLRNWWGILKKKEIIKNMKANTVLKKYIST